MRISRKYPAFLLVTTVLTAALVFAGLLPVLLSSVEREITKRGETTAESFAMANAPALLSYPSESSKRSIQLNLLAVGKNPDVLNARLADAQGTVIASLAEKDVGRRLPGFFTDPSAPTTWVDPKERAYHFRAPVRWGQDMLGTFVLSLSRTPLEVAMSSTIESAFKLVAGIAAVICIFALLLVRREVRPLKRMQLTLDEIAKGDFTQRMPEAGKDEIGELSAAFNQMLERSELFFRYVDKMVIDRMIADQSLAAPGGHQQDISVIFGDMRGFTAMSNRRTADEVVHIVNTYFHLFIECVAHCEGLVDKTMGDAIMAVFEHIGNEHEEGHKRRAVQATCYMKAASRVLNRFLLLRRAAGELHSVEPREFGFAIATGSAIVGNIGSKRRMNYTVSGRVVNLASRLEGLTKNGEVIIDNFTRLGATQIIRSEPLPPVQPKGFSAEEKVIPHRIVGMADDEAHKLRIFLKKLFGYTFLSEMVMPRNLPAGEQAPWCSQAELLVIRIIAETPVTDFFARADVNTGMLLPEPEASMQGGDRRGGEVPQAQPGQPGSAPAMPAPAFPTAPAYPPAPYATNPYPAGATPPAVPAAPQRSAAPHPPGPAPLPPPLKPA